METIPSSQILLIFGASGDLTHRKLLPALFELYREQALPSRFLIIGAARTRQSTEIFREHTRQSLESNSKNDSDSIKEFLRLIYYIAADPNNTADYSTLFQNIEQLRLALGIDDNIIFYLATPPLLYPIIATHLKIAGQNRSNNGRRCIIIEKPFGNSGNDARQTDKILKSCFNESDIYRIDHFLGKETVQNLLALRFSNEIWEPAWNRHYIDHITFSVTETIGIENRGSYYDKSGALRDMVQNHILQILAFVTMETPTAFTPKAIRNETAKLLQSLHPLTGEEIDKNVTRAQYSENIVEGKIIPGYRQEKDVSPDSFTETFVALRCHIDNRRWSGVPFYLLTGKRLNRKRSEIIIHFRNTPHPLFPGQCAGSSCNRLVIRLAPDEGIDLQFGLKRPGDTFTIEPVEMQFDYRSLPGYPLTDAYSRLLLDAMKGISLLYSRSDALLAGWHFIDPIEQHWTEKGEQGLLFYPAGSSIPFEGLHLCPHCHKDLECCPTHHTL